MNATNRFKIRRAEVGISQQKVAAIADCSLGTVRIVEYGQVPSEEMQRRLAAALETTPKALWG